MFAANDIGYSSINNDRIINNSSGDSRPPSNSKSRNDSVGEYDYNFDGHYRVLLFSRVRAYVMCSAGF